MQENWWKQAVIYQVYPRSFMDSNGDGIGDLPGITEKLDYLAELGIDAIWLSPVFRSPQYDNGYDVSDYRDIDPLFGSMEDCETLIREAGNRNIRVIMDLVLNHSSDEHPWFLAAKKSLSDPRHDYYIWRDKLPENAANGKAFGEASWKWVPEIGQYYYYQFSEKQPDLNWDNPSMRRELYDMIRWWVDKGVGGFRLDVVDHLGKDPDRGINVNGPRLHEFVREMSREAFREPGLVTVGEAWSANTESAKLYSAPDGTELSMVFQFEHILLDQAPGGDKWALAPLPLVPFKRVIERWQKTLHGCGWNSLFWENHDLPRIVSRWGDDGVYREQSAKMLAILLFGLEGTPYIYQGQELGMTNIELPLEAYRDIETVKMVGIHRALGWSEERILEAVRAKSRDNARTPMQWTDGENAGFTAGKPWFPINPNHRAINAEEQLRRSDSVLRCYSTLIRLRKKHPVFTDGAFDLLLPEDGSIISYTRSDNAHELLVLCNFTDNEIADPLAERESGELLISNYPDKKPGRLRPYEARMILNRNL